MHHASIWRGGANRVCHRCTDNWHVTFDCSRIHQSVFQADLALNPIGVCCFVLPQQPTTSWSSLSGTEWPQKWDRVSHIIRSVASSDARQTLPLNLFKPYQPIKKLTKRKVLRKTSSLARLNHSCVRNVLLDLEERALRIVTENMLALTCLLSWLQALTCPGCDLCYWREDERKLPFTKRTLGGWMSGDGIALAEGLWGLKPEAHLA
jgi:hypothetical protein